MKNKLNGIFNRVGLVVEVIISIILIVLIILTAFQRFSNQHNFFGYRIYTVASGSMIPTYNIGDTLLIKEMDASNIKEGDAVTYIGNDIGIDGMIITHQVQKVEIDKDGKYYFHTKGVANNIEDPVVSEDQVLGKVVYRFFFLSLFGMVTTSKPLLFCFICIPIAILIAMEIIRLIYKKEDDEDEEILEDSSEIDSDDEELNKIDTDKEKDDIIKEDRDDTGAELDKEKDKEE